MNIFQIIMGCALVLAGIFGKEFYPGRFGREQGFKPLHRGIGRLIFVGMGIAIILLGVENLHHRK